MRPWIWFGVTCVVVFVVIQGFATLRKGARLREEREREQATSAAREQLLDPPRAPATPAPKCRLCTVDAEVSGGLSQAAVVATLEAAFPLMDAQCLEPRTTRRGRGRRIKAASVTLAFAVRDGAATSRQVAATTSTDGVDECLSHALADVHFKSGVDPTTVRYTLQLDPSIPR